MGNRQMMSGMMSGPQQASGMGGRGSMPEGDILQLLAQMMQDPKMAAFLSQFMEQMQQSQPMSPQPEQQAPFGALR